MYCSVPTTCPTVVWRVAWVSALVRRATPKSRILGWPVGVDHDVGRLEIAVDDALLVGVVDRIADPGEELEALVQREARLLGVVGEGLPPHQLHREEGLGAVGALGGPGLVDLGDAGMLQPSEHFGLTGKASDQLGRARNRAG